MTDDLTPDELADEQASAYLDDELTRAQLADVDASPELVSRVTSFRAVREQLADVPAVDAGVRDAAVAAALAEFDLLQDDGDAPAGGAATVVPLSSRRRWPNQLLTAAAAVVVLGVAGIAVSNRGSDDKSSEASKEGGDRMTEMAASDTSNQYDAAGGSPTSTIGSIPGAATVSQVVNTPDELLALGYPETEEGSSETTAAPDDGSTNTQAGTDGDKLPVSTMTASGAMTCLTPEQVFLANIYYKGQFAIAARDTVSGVVIAVTDDCRIIESVSP